MQTIAAPLACTMLSLLFITSGFSKITGYAVTQGYMEAMGVPGALLHANFGDQIQMIMFMKNVSIAGGFLMIVSPGAGAFALDNRLDKHA